MVDIVWSWPNLRQNRFYTGAWMDRYVSLYNNYGHIYTYSNLVFTANMWNGLDFCFCCSFVVYFSLVVSGRGEEGHAILACGAVLLFPRYLDIFLILHCLDRY
jgi:hypothetical protein